MFDQHHYVPCVHTKQGEAIALLKLSSTAAAKTTPLFVVHKGEANATKTIKRCWKAHCFVYSSNPKDAEAVVVNLIADGIPAILAVDTGQLLGGFTPTANSNGVCIRLDPVNSGSLMAAFKTLKLPANQVDLIADFRDAPAKMAGTYASYALFMLQHIPKLKSWRTFTCLATGYPTSLGGKGGTTWSIPRECFHGWGALHGLPRDPSFGDYTVVNHFGGPLPEYVSVAAKIRYTQFGEWWIHRAFDVRNVKKGGYSQYNKLAGQLLAAPHFMGANHCAGCAEIAAKAAGGGPGNHGTWVWIAVNHHIEVATSQV